jgi:hypothetical protein
MRVFVILPSVTKRSSLEGPLKKNAQMRVPLPKYNEGQLGKTDHKNNDEYLPSVSSHTMEASRCYVC